MKKTVLTISTVAVVTLGSAFGTSSPAVYAQTSLDDVKSQQEDVTSKLSNAEAKIADVLYEIKDINAEIDRLDTALEENKSEIKKNEKKIDSLQSDIDDLKAQIEKRNDILKDRISSYQENGGNINYLEVFLGSKDFSDFVSRLSAVNSITTADADLIEENEKDKASVEKKLDEREKATQELEDQKATIDSQKKQKKESKTALKKKESKVNDDIAKLESESSELAALEDDIRASIEKPAEPEVAAETTDNSNDQADDDSNADNDSNSNNSSNDNSSNDNNNATNNNSNSNANNNNNNNNTSASNNNSNSSASASSNNESTPAKKKPSNNNNKVNSAPTGGGSAIAAGQKYIGNSTYSYGAQDPASGLFDCSGFVQWAYQQEGVSLPRTASAMASVGTKVPYSEAKAGDLVIFRGGTHVGIYMGGGKFLGSQTSTGVAVADMNSGYWAQHFDNNVRRIK